MKDVSDPKRYRQIVSSFSVLYNLIWVINRPVEWYCEWYCIQIVTKLWCFLLSCQNSIEFYKIKQRERKRRSDKNELSLHLDEYNWTEREIRKKGKWKQIAADWDTENSEADSATINRNTNGMWAYEFLSSRPYICTHKDQTPGA